MSFRSLKLFVVFAFFGILSSLAIAAVGRPAPADPSKYYIVIEYQSLQGYTATGTCSYSHANWSGNNTYGVFDNLDTELLRNTATATQNSPYYAVMGTTLPDTHSSSIEKTNALTPITGHYHARVWVPAADRADFSGHLNLTMKACEGASVFFYLISNPHWLSSYPNTNCDYDTLSIECSYSNHYEDNHFLGGTISGGGFLSETDYSAGCDGLSQTGGQNDQWYYGEFDLDMLDTSILTKTYTYLGTINSPIPQPSYVTASSISKTRLTHIQVW